MGREDQPQQDGGPEGTVALAEAVENDRVEIVRRWVERVGRGVEAAPELQVTIDELVRRMAELLRAGVSVTTPDLPLQDAARQYGVGRERQGATADVVVRELHSLRAIADEVLLERGTTPDRRLADLLGEMEANALRAHAEARELAVSRSESEQVAFITHELGNPLATALLATGQLRRHLGTSSQHTGGLDLLERNLKRLQSLVEGVLTTKRFDAGDLRTRAIDISVGQIMDDSLPNAREKARAKGLELRARYDGETLLHVDPQLTISAIQNVVDNAVKFTDQGQIDVYTEDRMTELAIHVRDACPGIPATEMKTIFEPFHRGASGKPGSGLGLAVARRAVEAQGGQIQVESVEGDIGCHFWLTLPKARH